jgi:hypothetical protein
MHCGGRDIAVTENRTHTPANSEHDARRISVR